MFGVVASDAGAHECLCRLRAPSRCGETYSYIPVRVAWGVLVGADRG